MKTFRCWAPDLETEDEARTYKAASWRDAAEAFAQWSHREEEFEELEVRVRCCESGKVYSVDVEAEMELNLYLGMGGEIAEDDEPNEGDTDEAEPEASPV